MAESQTTRFRLPQWSQGTDPYPGRTGWNNILMLLEDQAAIAFPSGPIANRPRSGTFGRFFLATDQGTPTAPVSRLYYDGGTGWVELNTNGGGGPAAAIAINGTASEGTSSRSARADHVHDFPLASSSRAGALAPQHFDLLNGASSTPDSGMLVRRTSSGNVVVPLVPGGDTNAASKSYVDNDAGTSSLVNGALVRRYTNGCFRAGMATHDDDVVSQKFMWSQTSASLTGGEGKIMRRWASGVGALVADPDNTMATANKRYVDGRVSRQAWKENARPLPYGLDEVVQLARKAKLYDYKPGEDAPLSVRGEKNHLGAYVEDVHAIMPLLAVDGEDGAPERITDRELIWPAYMAIAQLEERDREKDAKIAALVAENAALNDRIHRIEGYLGL